MRAPPLAAMLARNVRRLGAPASVIVRSATSSSDLQVESGGPLWPPPVFHNSSGADDVVLQRERADALAGRREEGIEHGRRRDRDGRLADAAPESTGRHH